MPHRTFAQVAKPSGRKEGSERVKTINALMGELPDYRNVPYADLRKWLQEVDRTRCGRRSRTATRSGAARGRLAGRARRTAERGKSSLQALSSIQIKTGDYVHDVAVYRAADDDLGVQVQLVEIPG
jgi:hypothetical protein